MRRAVLALLPLCLTLCGCVEPFAQSPVNAALVRRCGRVDLYGMDLFLAEVSEARMHGLSAGLFSTKEGVRGAQLGVMTATTTGEGGVRGLQLALATGILGSAGGGQPPSAGAQVGAMNVAQGLRGAQVGVIGNIAQGLGGAQLALLYNLALDGWRGAQVAAINRAVTLRGAQVGLKNAATRGGPGAQIGLLNVIDGDAFDDRPDALPGLRVQIGLLNFAPGSRWPIPLLRFYEP